MNKNPLLANLKIIKNEKRHPIAARVMYPWLPIDVIDMLMEYKDVNNIGSLIKAVSEVIYDGLVHALEFQAKYLKTKRIIKSDPKKLSYGFFQYICDGVSTEKSRIQPKFTNSVIKLIEQVRDTINPSGEPVLNWQVITFYLTIGLLYNSQSK